MDQVKIGGFLKALRNEKGLTQEQLAEKMNVTRRSVSRWETGSNMPDLDVLLALADFYGVALRELLDGERQRGEQAPELRETTMKLVDYSSTERQRLLRRMHAVFAMGLVAAITYAGMCMAGMGDSPWAGFCLGAATGVLIIGTLMTSRYAAKVRAFKLRLLGQKGADA